MCTAIIPQISNGNIKINLNSYSINAGSLILVNKGNEYKLDTLDLESIDKSYLKTYGKSPILLNKYMNKSLNELIKAINGKRKIVAVSGYRNKDEQREIFESSVKEKGIKFTKKYVARPGESEHQTGLAVDLGEDLIDINFICPSFPNKGICKSYNELASEYGFIMRYSKDKEHITGISEEKWHFRYVGRPHAQIIYTKNYCLEEYIDYIRKFKYEERHLFIENEKESIEIFFVNENRNIKEVTLPNEARWVVSGNNVDGFIFTIYKTKERN